MTIAMDMKMTANQIAIVGTLRHLMIRIDDDEPHRHHSLTASCPSPSASSLWQHADYRTFVHLESQTAIATRRMVPGGESLSNNEAIDAHLTQPKPG